MVEKLIRQISTETRFRSTSKTRDYIMNAEVRKMCSVSAATANQILATFTTKRKIVKYFNSSHWYTVQSHIEIRLLLSKKYASFNDNITHNSSMKHR